MGKALRMAGALLAALTLTLVGAEAEGQQVPAPETPARPEAAAGMYVVRPGDNLWTLSGQFLHNPFLWPRIWERNKFVLNPNRIYPGDPLLIP
ncbi:MAG: LysM peptidoglycan-binding domain-containing protein, partial [Candidatus Methylomirabilales bacterium]